MNEADAMIVWMAAQVVDREGLTDPHEIVKRAIERQNARLDRENAKRQERIAVDKKEGLAP